MLATSHGKITMKLDAAKAPCTVQSFEHLILHRFYNNTSCHRLTAYPTLKVLQCGDPSGTGSGGPGYQYKDELPTDLPPVPDRPDRVYYPDLGITKRELAEYYVAVAERALPGLARRPLTLLRCPEGIEGEVPVLRVVSDTDNVATQGPVWYVGGKVL